MKSNNKRKKSNKSNKTSLSKLSPTNKNKATKNNNFNLTTSKNKELNNIISSPKKNKEEANLPKKKIILNTAYHRKTKSSSQNYIQYQNFIKDSNTNLNNSVSKLSYIFRRNEFKKNFENMNYNTSSRNKYELFKKKIDRNKKSSNLLSISFSLKEFRNNIINAFTHSNINEIQKGKLSNKSNTKNNRSLFIFDNLNNIEETRNTTSITGFNNSNLLYKKQMKVKDNKNVKSTKYIKINRKQRKNLFSSNNNSTKSITFTNNNHVNCKIKEKNKIYQYIYNYNNINIESNKEIKNKQKNTKNLALSKRTYKNSVSKVQSTKKISFINAISENIKLHYKNKNNNYKINSLKSPKNKNVYVKFRGRKNKSQENRNKIGVQYNNKIGEFQSVEEIHFIFVQMNQKKKAFFENQYNQSTFN